MRVTELGFCGVDIHSTGTSSVTFLQTGDTHTKPSWRAALVSWCAPYGRSDMFTNSFVSAIVKYHPMDVDK